MKWNCTFEIMKRVFFLLMIVVCIESCYRGTCPAYMNGGSTGTLGESSKSKPLPLFGGRMNKHH